MNKLKILMVASLFSAVITGCGCDGGSTSPTPTATPDSSQQDTSMGDAVTDVTDGMGDAVENTGDAVGKAMKDTGRAMTGR